MSLDIPVVRDTLQLSDYLVNDMAEASMYSRQTTAIIRLNENEFENGNHVLGHGGMGTVSLYKWKTRGGKEVAVKALHNTRSV